MSRHPEQSFRQRWEQYGFKNLLGWLFLYLAVAPFLQDSKSFGIIISIFLTVVMISALAAMGASRGAFALGAVALVNSLVLLWLQSSKMITPELDVSSLSLAIFLLVVACSFVRHLFLVRKVSGNVICAALCVYLVIGLLWGCLFSVLESLDPGSFAGTLIEGSASPEEVSHHLRYFSYVTLSTLGYGDITPQTPEAAALCQSEAIFGQFLTLVLVARLVGIQVAQQTTGKD